MIYLSHSRFQSSLLVSGMSVLRFVSIFGFLTLSSGVVATDVFPNVTGRALTGDDFTVPDDLGEAYNLIVVAFLQKQQPDVDTWIPHMETLESEREDFAFYEFPTISKMNPVMRWIIYRGMRGGIPGEPSRARTVTLHIDKAPFTAQLGIDDEDQIYAFLVDQEGRVLWRETGLYSKEKDQALREFLGSK